MSFEDMEQSGVLFVNYYTAFSMPYLHLTYLRLLRAKNAPGQEAAVLEIFHADNDLMFNRRATMRDYLLRALEAWALARKTPSEVIPFNLDYPAKHAVRLRELMLFPPTHNVGAIAFDGHFGLHRPLVPGCDPERVVPKAGHPRKRVHEDERSCSCKRKDTKRLALPQRTGGWQFALDPDSRRVLGAIEHVANENHDDKMPARKGDGDASC